MHVSSPDELELLHSPFVNDLTPSPYAKQLLLYVFPSQPHTGSNNKIQATFSPLRHCSLSNRSPSGHLQLSMHFGHSAHESFGKLKISPGLHTGSAQATHTDKPLLDDDVVICPIALFDRIQNKVRLMRSTKRENNI